ncbi:chaperonin Cpn60/TCP-1 family, partial [Kipferlia bialata]
GLQDREVGDGTTSVVIIAAEFLRNSAELMKAKLHPTNIIQGYTHALKKAIKFIENYLTISTEEIEEETLLNVARTSMSSKIISNQAELFARIIVDAMK